MTLLQLPLALSQGDPAGIGPDIAIAAWAITRNIADPLREIVQGATQIAEGDLSVRITTSDRADEVGVLQRAFALMTRGLQEMAAVATRIADGDIRNYRPTFVIGPHGVMRFADSSLLAEASEQKPLALLAAGSLAAFADGPF